jgi:DNA polymerase-3 subunit epsilon
MDFVAIDVETANADISSICQIGIARFTAGRLADEWCTLVDPEDEFDDINVSIHGIEPHMVGGQPRLPQIAEHLRAFLEGGVTVCHTHFDRLAIIRGFTKYGLAPPATSWLDSARVARRAWTEFAWSGYGLANICAKIGYEFRHHDALEDAKAAGYVLLAAIREAQLDLDGWQHRVSQPIDLTVGNYAQAIRRDGDPEGDLYGEVVVFTGTLELPRASAADLAASLGCRVDSGVTKRTTLLVVGDQDARHLAGHEKSTKHRKAEQLVATGQRIRIIREADFRCLCSSHPPPTVAHRADRSNVRT